MMRRYRHDLDFFSCSCSDEGMEMLVRGMSGNRNASQNSGKITTANFFFNDITTEGMRWFSNSPQLRRQMQSLWLEGWRSTSVRLRTQELIETP